MIFVLIKDGIVEHCIAVDSISDLTAVYPDYLVLEQTGNETVGWSYDGSIFYPPVGANISIPTRITKLAFFSRFSDAEAISIDLASYGNTVQAASLRRFLKKVELATYIDLNSVDTRQGVQALEYLGYIQPGRSLEILDTPATLAEMYRE